MLFCFDCPVVGLTTIHNSGKGGGGFEPVSQTPPSLPHRASKPRPTKSIAERLQSFKNVI